jgi:hypothetical protein
MDRMTIPLDGVYPTHPEWDGFWSSVGFLVDPLGSVPIDISGWCWSPFQAEAVFEGGTRATNVYGPAMAFDNVNTNFSGSNGWLWTAYNDLRIPGSDPPWDNWTLALGWDKRVYDQTNALTILHLYTRWGWHYLLKFNPGTGDYEWYSSRYGGYQLNGFSGVTGRLTAGNTVVITTEHLRRTVIYADGKEVASAPWGSGVFLWRYLYVGCDYATTEAYCLGGTVGPFVLSRSAWSPTQAAQFAADPWGYNNPRLNDAIMTPVDEQTDLGVNVGTRPRVGETTGLASRVGVSVGVRPRLGATIGTRERLGVSLGVRPEGD